MTSSNISHAKLPLEPLDSLECLDARVKTALIVIRNEGYSKKSVDRAAALVNLSATRLTHLFKEKVGMSPRGYDKHLRLSKAENLIKTTYLRIKEIEAKCGFKDSSRFARQFKKAFGLTPTECRAHALANQTVGEQTAAPFGRNVR